MKRLLFAAVLLAALPARADTPLSKCWSWICAEPQVSVSVLALELPGRHVTAGVLPVGSIGYGVRTPGDWLAAGIFLSARAGGAQPGFLAPSLQLRVARAFTVGAQWTIGEGGDKLALLVGGGFGL